MRILVTNDDGINAPGLAILQAIAAEIAGPDGEVWTVAPAFEQSGVAHCISYTHPTMIAQLSERVFAAEGSPADCVLAGVHDVLRDTPPDLILSGVNRGNNSGENVMYSGTLGGALEGALQDVLSIALSQYLGPDTNPDAPFDAAAAWGAQVVRTILAADPGETGDYRLFYNVNFPACPAAQVAGIQVVPQGRRVGTKFTVQPHASPSGRRFLWVRGGDQRAPSTPGSDVAVNMEGYVSVTPMRADLTAHDALHALQSAFS